MTDGGTVSRRDDRNERQDAPFPARLVMRLEVPNEGDVHPEIMRDDISDALVAKGFSGFTLDVQGTCECGHPMSEHDQYGCLVAECCDRKGVTVNV